MAFDPSQFANLSPQQIAASIDPQQFTNLEATRLANDFTTAQAANAAQVARNAIDAAAQQAQAAYNQALLQQGNDKLAFDRASQAFQEAIGRAGLTGVFEGNATQPALQFGATNFGIWGTPQPGQQTLNAQQQYAANLGSYQGQQTLQSQNQAFSQWLARQSEARLQSGQEQQSAQAYLQMLAGLRGPADWMQYQKVLGATPQGLSDLVRAAAGQYIPGGGATTGVQPTPASLQTLVGSMNGGQPTAQAGAQAPTAPGSFLGQLFGMSQGAPFGAVPGSPGTIQPQAATTSGMNNGTGNASAATGKTSSFAPGSYGTPSAPRYYAPGPNSPNDTQPGTPMPGTTGMMQGATQNWSIAGPSTGSTSATGTRGTDVVGWGPQGLTFNAQFLQPKSKAVFNLWDETTNQNVADNSAVVGATKGNGSGWGGAYYVPVPAGGGQFTFGGVSPSIINPSHEYSIRVALPDEGGGVGSERHFSGADLLARQQAQQQAAPAQPAQPAIDPNFMAPDTAYKQALAQQNPAMQQAGYRDMLQRTRGYVWSPDEAAAPAAAPAAASQAAPWASLWQALTQLQPQAQQATQPQAVPSGSTANAQATMATLVPPNQMAPQTWNNLTPSQQQMLLGTWESQGYNNQDAQALFRQSLPRYTLGTPNTGTFRLQ